MHRGKEPSEWKVEKLADVGMGEEFVRQVLDLNDIVGASNMDEPARIKTRGAISIIVVDGLIPAFLELRKIRSLDPTMPLIDRYQPFEDFARKIWKPYKALMPAAAKLIGFDVGFLFQNEQHFENGLRDFRAKNPNAQAAFEDYLRDERRKWQNRLANFRNFLEHSSSDRKDFREFYVPKNAEGIFVCVWRAIVEVLAVLLELKLWPGWSLIEQDPDDPGPRWPQRFQLVSPHFRTVQEGNYEAAAAPRTDPPG